ncbi:MAG TPA: hypothetical protein VEL11_14840 [Candidatus Bathyarchaeia archaeon]|nr:hypothetical protein [Candidatus Bathyarchaeia archaeon]
MTKSGFETCLLLLLQMQQEGIHLIVQQNLPSLIIGRKDYLVKVGMSELD